jgi:hypothetical protein
MLDFLFTLVTVLAAAAFGQFGVTLDSKPGAQTAANPEVRRTVQGGAPAHGPLPSQMSGQMPGQMPGMKAAAHVVRLPAPAVPTVGRKGG